MVLAKLHKTYQQMVGRVAGRLESCRLYRYEIGHKLNQDV